MRLHLSRARRADKALMASCTERIRGIRPPIESLAEHYASIRGEGNPSKQAYVREKIAARAKERWESVSKADPKFRQSAAMHRWAMTIKVRDKFTCSFCGLVPLPKDTIADHIKPYCLYPELALEESNGRTLCRSCHTKTPTYGIRALLVDGHLPHAIIALSETKTPVLMESVITSEMIAAFATQYEISLEDGTQEAGVRGSLAELESGHGTLPDWMLTNEIFGPLVTVHGASKHEEPIA